MITERRAEFVYNAARLAAIAAQAPIVPAQWEEREEAFRTQFLEVIERQMGDQRSSSPEELHGSWMQAYFEMGWVYGEEYDREMKTHPDLISYGVLGQLVKLVEAAVHSIPSGPFIVEVSEGCVRRGGGRHVGGRDQANHRAERFRGGRVARRCIPAYSR